MQLSAHKPSGFPAPFGVRAHSTQRAKALTLYAGSGQCGDLPMTSRPSTYWDPSWRSEASSSDHEHTASEATHHGGSKHHDLEDLENKADEPISHGSCAPLSPSQGALPLKVMPAPPPKENAWARRSTGGGANTTTLTATSSGDVAHKGSSSSSSDEHVSDENWLDV
ncbi:eukaryotic translation initiation factor 4B-like [Tachysurus fulvidraco]|uniref:eukaryotic translation initiation factor 4B-like n=1 Tax=Tachysurus fulvidraco TaxID=1234273 RepID=UPI001FEEF0CF|nr:eukaryotic translation initiation factor 4B-like [Tachysurus fulvidraco]